MFSRWQFTPFWKLTRWGFLFPSMFGPAFKINKGCDEYHNETRFVFVPLVGDLTWWKTTDFSEPHLFGRTGGIWHGKFYPDCSICKEIKETIDV